MVIKYIKKLFAKKETTAATAEVIQEVPVVVEQPKIEEVEVETVAPVAAKKTVKTAAKKHGNRNHNKQKKSI